MTHEIIIKYSCGCEFVFTVSDRNSELLHDKLCNQHQFEFDSKVMGFAK